MAVMMMKSVEEPAPGNESASLCGFEYGLCYLFLGAVAVVVAVQYSVDPAIGGISGFISSALRLPFSETWGLIGALGCWLAGTILVAWVAKRIPPERERGALLRRALVLIGSAAAAGLAAWLYSVDRGLLPALAFWTAPAAGVLILVKVSMLWRAALLILVAASATVAVVGLILTLQPSNARAGTDWSAFTEQERVYAEQLIETNYDCHDKIKPFAPTKTSRDYVSRVIDVDILGPGQYRALLQVSNRMRLPTHRIALYYAERARVDVRPEYVSVCLLEPWRSNRAPSAPWRWRRSADGGASWADIPHNPHTQSAKTAGYTYRYVPTKADLADANILLRACVDVRGGGEVCTPGVRPRP